MIDTSKTGSDIERYAARDHCRKTLTILVVAHEAVRCLSPKLGLEIFKVFRIGKIVSMQHPKT